MTRQEEAALWQRLQSAGLVRGELRGELRGEMPPAAASSPWFVRAMLGVAGWIGALFLLLFLGTGFDFVLKSAVASLVTGTLCCAAALFFFRMRPEGEFATQFGFAISLAGQGLLLVGFDHATGSTPLATALAMACVQVVLFAALPNPLHRTWSALALLVALAFALGELNALALAPGLFALACMAVWLNPAQQTRAGAVWRSAGYGAVFALMSVTAVAAWTHGAAFWIDFEGRLLQRVVPVWAGGALAGGALVWAAWTLLRRAAVPAGSAAGARLLIVAAVPALASLPAPGLAPALLVLLLGQASGNRVLVGLGIVFLPGYLAFYYYSLSATLLEKSLLLLFTGLVLLAVRRVLLQQWPEIPAGESGHA